MIPEYTKAALNRYIKHGIMPGGFLTAVLSNDLFGAVAHADSDNMLAIPDIVKFIYMECPSSCWGSRQAVLDYARQVSAQEMAL